MKKFIKMLLIVLIVAMISIPFVACKKKNDVFVENAQVGASVKEMYFAVGEVDTTKAFDSEISNVTPSDVAVLEGNNLKLLKTGTFKFTKNEKEMDGVVVDGKNVTNFAEYKAAYVAGQKICIQADIRDIKALDLTEDINNHGLTNDVYGNGHYINAYEVANKNYSILDVRAKGVKIYNVHISGYEFKEGEAVNLTTFESIGTKGGGPLLHLRGDYSADVKGCIFENGHKLALISEGQVNIEGCLFRNASDTLISVETGTFDGAKVTLKNNVLANAIVGGVCLWGYTKIKDENSYVTLNIEGFLDIYNWKEAESAVIMPGTEDFAGPVNKLVASEVKKDSYSEFFYVENGKNYIHCGIIRLATSGLATGNKAKINYNKDTLKFQERSFPLPSNAIVKSIVKTCTIIGHTTHNDPVEIKPSDKLEDNKHLKDMGINIAN